MKDCGFRSNEYGLQQKIDELTRLNSDLIHENIQLKHELEAKKKRKSLLSKIKISKISFPSYDYAPHVCGTILGLLIVYGAITGIKSCTDEASGRKNKIVQNAKAFSGKLSKLRSVNYHFERCENMTGCNGGYYDCLIKSENEQELINIACNEADCYIGPSDPFDEK